ncbi:hypothetical protein COT72_01485 [archaeon CG10_big_fil_rev_8_21_14_0_10_43_11]|nr:MAG: hypothetical protein COT72_01485 [archaeon CG10_big_fil_rev_8_21_14_0_10_43_11]
MTSSAEFRELIKHALADVWKRTPIQPAYVINGEYVSYSDFIERASEKGFGLGNSVLMLNWDLDESESDENVVENLVEDVQEGLAGEAAYANIEVREEQDRHVLTMDVYGFIPKQVSVCGKYLRLTNDLDDVLDVYAPFYTPKKAVTHTFRNNTLEVVLE